MMTVEIQVPASYVSTPMKTMRRWLDHMRFEASNFNWTEIAGRAMVQIKFKVVEEAAAFAKHFAGRVL